MRRVIPLSRRAPYQKEHIVSKLWAKCLKTGHSTYGVLRGSIQDEPCAALLAVLEYEDDSLQARPKAQPAITVYSPVDQTFPMSMLLSLKGWAWV